MSYYIKEKIRNFAISILGGLFGAGMGIVIFLLMKR